MTCQDCERPFSVTWAQMYRDQLARAEALLAECDRLREALMRVDSACEALSDEDAAFIRDAANVQRPEGGAAQRL